MASSSAFERGLAFVLRIEGGYVNDPYDNGGATNKGIIQRTYDGWRKSLKLPARDVREITGEEVRDIYRRRFWGRASCPLLPDDVAIAHFDAAVNHGVLRAGKLLQRATAQGLAEDGIVGPATLAGVEAWSDQKLLVKAYLRQRQEFYHGLVERDPWQNRFIRGWLKRLTWLHELLLGEPGDYT